MAGPFDASKLPTDEERETQRKLDLTQGFAVQRNPEAARDALELSRESGIPFEAAEQKVKEGGPGLVGKLRRLPSWDRLAAEAPVLAGRLSDPGRAAAMSDDVERLTGLEKLFGRGKSGFLENTKDALLRGETTRKLANIGWDELMRQATPEQIAEAGRLEEFAKAHPDEEMGLITGIPAAAAESAPLMGQTLARSAGYAGGGALVGAGIGAAGGAVAGGVGALPGAIGGAGTGAAVAFRAGTFIESGKSEGGLAFREFRALPGVSEEAARGAAFAVGIVNGALEAVGLEAVFKVAPALKRFVGKGARSAVGKILKDEAKQAAFVKFAKHIATAGFTEGITEALQELSTVIGGAEAASPDAGFEEALGIAWRASKENAGRIKDAGIKGAQGGIGFGGLSGAVQFRADVQAARAAQDRKGFFEELGKLGSESTTRERLPEEFRAYVDAMTEKYGPIENINVPADKIRALFQKEGITDKEIAEKMPEVAKALEAAEAIGQGESVEIADEVAVPLADFATHIAPLEGFKSIQEDVRVGDEPTLREAKEIEKRAKKVLEEMKSEEARAGLLPESSRTIFEDVYKKLSDVGISDATAQRYATLWTAFAETRAKRKGTDAFEEYKGFNLEISNSDLVEALAPDEDAELLTPEQVALKEKAKRGDEGALDQLIGTIKVDPLTGANSAATWKVFNSKKRPGVYLSIDVNDLKRINDTISHSAGSEYLKAITGAIGPAIRGNKGKFFRAGGDEFVAHFLDRAAADAAVKALTEAMNAMPALFEGKHKASISLGLGSSFAQADAAGMKGKERAKAAGRSGFREGSKTTPDLSQGDVFAEIDESEAPTPMDSQVQALMQGVEDYGGSHRPPDAESGAPAHDLTGEGRIYPDDVYGPDAQRIYGDRSVADAETFRILRKLKGNPDAEVTIYRAVPKGVQSEINRGDWVTPSRKYAEMHGARFDAGMDIIEKKVTAKEIFTNGDSIHEFGYWPETQTLKQKKGEGALTPDERYRLESLLDREARRPGYLDDTMTRKEMEALRDRKEKFGQEMSAAERSALEEAEEEARKKAPKILPKNFKGIKEGRKPKLFNHGTSQKFDRFEAGEFGFHFGDENAASMYGSDYNGGLIRAYLDIRNPMRTEDLGDWKPEDVTARAFRQKIITGEEFAAVKAEIAEGRERLKARLENEENTDEAIIDGKRAHYALSRPVRELLKSKGVDGIVYRNEGEGFADSYIAFDDEQIIRADKYGSVIGKTTLKQGVEGERAFHGTPMSGFHTFDPGQGDLKLDPGWLGEAVAYFSSRADVASYYAGRYGTGWLIPSRGVALSPGIYPARLNTEKYFQWGKKGRGVMDLAARGVDLPGELTDPVLKRAGITREELGKDNYPDLVPDLARALTAELKARGYDGVVAEVEDGGHEFAVYNPATITHTLVQKGGAKQTEDYRGKIEFDDTRKWFKVTLTGSANLSTFLHESGHAFLEILRRDAMAGDAQSAADLAALEAWMAVDTNGDREAALEKFARGFETYLMEGKAPSATLAEVFRAVKEWLKIVYKALTRLNAPLTDEVRDVMDRLLATDEEIQAARSKMGLFPVVMEGMTPEESAAFADRYERAVQAKREEMERDAMGSLRRAVQDAQREIRTAVEKAATKRKEFNAAEFLRTGKPLDPDFKPAPEIDGKKLSKKTIGEYIEEGDKRKIKLMAFVSDDGVDADAMAPFLGYEDGQALITALLDAPSRAGWVKEEVERRMKDKYPDAELTALTDKALEKLHDPAIDTVLEEELDAFERKTGAQPTPRARDVLRASAKLRAQEMTQQEMQPGLYLRNEERASREVLAAVAKKDYMAARDARRRQMWNRFMYREVTKAKEEINKTRDYLKTFEDLPVRKRIGKAGEKYLNAIDAIIDGIEFTKKTDRALARRNALESYLAEMEKEGDTITIPPELRAELGLKNYRQMTLAEIIAVREAVKNVEHMARLKNKLLMGKERRDFAQTTTKLAEHIRANVGVNFQDGIGEPTWWDKKKAWMRNARSNMTKIEFIARVLDGGKTAGWAHELLFLPFADAQAKKWAMTKEITEELLKPFRAMSVKDRIRFDKRHNFLGHKLKLKEIIALMLNMGNEGNKMKLLKGFGFTEQAVMDELNEMWRKKIITDADLNLVQHIWDTIGKLWPDIRDLAQRHAGVAPIGVEPVSLAIGDRTLGGGYYPVVYNRNLNHKAEQIAQRKTGDLFENNFLLPAVEKGFTESRTKFFAPVSLSLDVIPSHINEIVHYLSHFEAVRAVDKITSSKVVKEAITEGLGREVYGLFRPWLQAIAADGVVHESTKFYDSIFRTLRLGSSIAILGFKMTTGLFQWLGLTGTTKELGRYTATGGRIFVEKLLTGKNPFREVRENSPEFANIDESHDRDISQMFRKLGGAFSQYGHLKDNLAHFALAWMMLNQKAVNAITWYGAREKAMAEDHPNPEAYADSVVRLTQSGGGIKDLAAIQRGSETEKMFTVMYTYFSVMFNQLTEAMPNKKLPAKMAIMAARWWWLVTLPVLLETAVKNGLPDDDKDREKYLEALTLGQIMYSSRTIPVAGDALQAFASDREARYGAWFATLLRGAKAAGDVVKGDATGTDIRDLENLLGAAGGLPVNAARNTFKYLDKIQNGSMQEPIPNLLFRNPSEWE